MVYSFIFQIIQVTLNRQMPVTEILPTAVTGIDQLMLEVLSVDNDDSGSLRVDFLGCMEGSC